MLDLLTQYYEWLRAAHIISVIAWMAGLLYLPRLFVYHAGVEKGSEASETFKIMERKLLRFIMAPASILAWIFGILMLVAVPSMLSGAGWMHVKLLCVVLMTVFHHMLLIWFKAFRDDINIRDAKFFRIINEMPTVLMVIIVIMAVAQPF